MTTVEALQRALDKQRHEAAGSVPSSKYMQASQHSEAHCSLNQPCFSAVHSASSDLERLSLAGGACSEHNQPLTADSSGGQHLYLPALLDCGGHIRRHRLSLSLWIRQALQAMDKQHSLAAPPASQCETHTGIGVMAAAGCGQAQGASQTLRSAGGRGADAGWPAGGGAASGTALPAAAGEPCQELGKLSQHVSVPWQWEDLPPSCV